MKKYRFGFDFLSSVFFSLAMMHSIFLVDIIVSKEPMIGGSLLLHLPIWFLLLSLSTSLIYQAWFCLRVKKDKLVHSNWRDDRLVGVIYLAINIVYVIAGIICCKFFSQERNEIILGITWTVLYFGFMFFMQERINKVRDFLSIEENEVKYKDMLAIGGLE